MKKVGANQGAAWRSAAARAAVLLLCAVVLCLAALPVMAESGVVRTGGGSLNLRRKPEREAVALIHIPNGATVDVLADQPEGWYEVKYKGVTGFVMAEYIALGETGEDLTFYTNTGAFAFLRQSADDDAKLLTVITYTMPITIEEHGQEWSRVTVRDSEGKQFTGYVRTTAISQNRVEPARGDGTQIMNLNAEAVLTSEQKLYEWPETSAFVAAVVPAGTTVTVTTAEGAWSHIRVDAFSGYVRSSAVQLTGKAVEAPKDVIAGYEASHYTATAPSGSLQLYAEPTSRLVTDKGQTLFLDPAQKLTVLQRGMKHDGKQWTLVSDGINTGWVLSESLTFSDTMEKYLYPAVVTSSAQGVAYAGPGGASLYAMASVLSNRLILVPEGEEVEITLGTGYVSAVYKGHRGYIPREQLVMGFVHVPGWTYAGSNAAPPSDAQTDDANRIPRSDARSAADKALAAAYAAFKASDYEVTSESYAAKGNAAPYYDFAYYKGGRFLYRCKVNALTGEALSTADYTAFVPTYTNTPAPTKEPDKRDDGEIGYSKARKIADAALAAKYENFAGGEYRVDRSRHASKPGYEGPFYQFDYSVGDFGAFICMVKCDTGEVIYTANTWDPLLTEIDYSTPTPAPVYESTVLIGKDAARAIADDALRGKYPDFASASISHVNERFSEDGRSFEPPYYTFDYYVDGEFIYSAVVHGYTGRVLYLVGGLPGEGNG